MPPFLAPQTNAQKRKAPDEDHEVILKRPNLGQGGGQDHYWMVQWRNKQTRKNKSWEGDGVLVALGGGSRSTLYDTDTTVLGSGKLDGPFTQGREMCFGGAKDIMLDCELTAGEFYNGSCFATDMPVQMAAPVAPPKPAFKPPKTTFNAPIPKQDVNAKPQQSASSSSPSHTASSQENILTPTNINGPLKDSYWSANWSVPLLLEDINTNSGSEICRRKTGNSKKKSTWEGDSYIKHENANITMISEEGKVMGVTSQKTALAPGQRLFIGGKEIQLVSEVTKYQIPRGAGQTELDGPNPAPVVQSVPSPASNKRYIAPASFYGAPAKPPAPRHDPKAEGAIVMKYPTKEHQERHNKKDRPIVDVVLDPILARKMRPHQHEGVKFLYECVMGLRKHEGQGSILADEM
ncbi:helicase [Marasmius tenuissimus]|nr:helicase [Marasmius tenuissimus]